LFNDKLLNKPSMKKYRKIILNSLTASVAFFIAGCSGVDLNKLAKEQQLKTNPSPLELHGDSVKFEMSAVVPVKVLKKNKIYTVNVDYKAFENRINVGKIALMAMIFQKLLPKHLRFQENSVLHMLIILRRVLL
jgi:hypothetical protein